MQPIAEIVQSLLEDFGYDRMLLATEIGTSPASLQRYSSGASKPRPNTEGQIRSIYSTLHSNHRVSSGRSLYLATPLLRDEAYVRRSVDAVLRQLRETLHRRGRLSSRAEALDEVSKLLFAHVMSVTAGEGGISQNARDFRDGPPSSTAVALKRFVQDSFDRYMPKSLAHEIDPRHFTLAIQPQENTFASEIIKVFGHMDLSATTSDGSDLATLDLMNDIFGKFLVDSFVDEKELGQYLTPTEVVKYMVQLALTNLSPDEMDLLCHPERCVDFGLILDPSCGTGSFLTELLRHLRGRVERIYGKKAAAAWLQRMVTEVIVGIDKSERMVRLALTSMALFGFPAAKLHLANALARVSRDASITSELDGRVRLIVTNPPFGAEFEGGDLSKYSIAAVWPHHPPKHVVSEVLFVERYIDWLMPNGQCVTVVPDSILSNKGLYSDLRCNVGKKVELQSVTSLPAVTFAAAGTMTKTSVLQFRKRDADAPKPVTKGTFFAICQHIGFEVVTKGAQRTKVAKGSSDLPSILGNFNSPISIVETGRWIRGAEAAHRWDATYHSSLALELEQRIDNPLPDDLFVRDVADLSVERADPRRWGSDTFEYIEIADVDLRTCTVHSRSVSCADAPSRARKRVHAGDVLVSTVRPERRVIGVVRNDQDGAICTTGFAVLRPRGIDPLTLAYVLKSDLVTAQILRHNNGIAYPAVDEECISNVLLPIKRVNIEQLSVRAQIVQVLERDVEAVRQDYAQDVAMVVRLNTAAAT